MTKSTNTKNNQVIQAIIKLFKLTCRYLSKTKYLLIILTNASEQIVLLLLQQRLHRQQVEVRKLPNAV